MKKFLNYTLMFVAIVAMGITFTACGKNDDSKNEDNLIVGKWADGHKIMELGKNGSYYSYYDNDSQYSRREGSYSYNPSQSLLIVNVPASAKNGNGDYKQTYIVQTLTKTTLVLLYTDGDVQGYYTRK
ncbi:MAG: hypothetical protein J6E29_07010 [Prevotella sp.]|nr:hypothetical protein [Prevotella sp.]